MLFKKTLSSSDIPSVPKFVMNMGPAADALEEALANGTELGGQHG